MTAWQIALGAMLLAFMAYTLHNIFLEIRSIRVMMNRDRGIDS